MSRACHCRRPKTCTISDIRTPVRPRGSTQPSKVWPRRCLAARTSPRGWRRTERLLERAGECSFRVVANHLGNLCEGRAGVTELLSRDLHAPTGEVVHRRHANQTDEAVGQRRTLKRSGADLYEIGDGALWPPGIRVNSVHPGYMPPMLNGTNANERTDKIALTVPPGERRARRAPDS